ncbi:MAG: hypothetical protein ABI883_06330, partial [Chthoniobacterales bacterium]
RLQLGTVVFRSSNPTPRRGSAHNVIPRASPVVKVRRSLSSMNCNAGELYFEKIILDFDYASA